MIKRQNLVFLPWVLPFAQFRKFEEYLPQVEGVVRMDGGAVDDSRLEEALGLGQIFLRTGPGHIFFLDFKKMRFF